MRLAAMALPLAGLLFNAVLCLLHTRGMPTGPGLVAAVELAIVAGALGLAWRDALSDLLVPALLLVLNVAALALFSGETDFKILVDLAIPAGFLLLGRHYAAPGQARTLFCVASLLVFAVGCFEMFALPAFESMFHVYDYYVAKGTLVASHAHDTGTLLAENGVRPGAEGRQLLPGLLGLHRAGSVFLEPVSAGDFAAICVAWVVATRDWRGQGLLTLGLGLATGVLADARFSIASSVAIAAFLATPLWRSRWTVALLPAFTLLGLLAIGIVSHHEVDNSALGRLTGSGQLLGDWGLTDWLGLEGGRHVSMDTGFSYVIGNLGLIGAAALWAACCIALPRAGDGSRLFAAIAVYLSLSLCISSSALSIKTASLLWFGLGALISERSRERREARPALPPWAKLSFGQRAMPVRAGVAAAPSGRIWRG